MTEQAKGERSPCGCASPVPHVPDLRCRREFEAALHRAYTDLIITSEEAMEALKKWDREFGAPTPPPAPEPAKAKDCRCASVMDGRGGMCPAHPCEPAPGPAKGGEVVTRDDFEHNLSKLLDDYYDNPRVETVRLYLEQMHERLDREKARADGLEAKVAKIDQWLREQGYAYINLDRGRE
jgi:hypothetical protein